jgi:two-component system, chemotaxis family, protein-glutamate methylesterase/glutaminase
VELRMMICEGSSAYACALQRLLEHDGDIRVAAILRTAEETLAALPRIRPGLVTMDFELPGMDGLAAIEEIMSDRPVPILVISARVGQPDRRAAAALAAGAIDVIGKDQIDLGDPRGAAAVAFRQRIKVLSQAHVIHHPRARLRGTPVPRRSGREASVIGICGSTGAPYVLAHLLGGLAADYPVPILVVQHISAGFTEGLVRWLDQTVRLPVRLAADGVVPGPGAWVAPQGVQLERAATGRLSLRRDVTALHHPSGDVLFGSIAATAADKGVAIVLSGMGSDGARGAAAVRQAGGLAIAQDRQSSAIYGMPAAAIDRGIELVLSPDDIIACLTGLRLGQEVR